MNQFLLFTTLLFCASAASAQKFSGQWKGQFYDQSSTFAGFGGDQCEYVLEIETHANKVSGFSYTYFTRGGQRYYIICKISGYIDPSKRYIEVKETERTKTNVPTNMRNCFQVHKLYYDRDNEIEYITGKWVPAPNQNGDCGFGITQLERRSLRSVIPTYNARSVTQSVKKAQVPTRTSPATASTAKPPVKRTETKPATPSRTRPAVTEKRTEVASAKTELKSKETTPQTTIREETGNSPELQKVETSFLNRGLTLAKTIVVTQPTIKVDVYDNAEVDGDSISLYFNGKQILKNHRLCAKGYSIQIPVSEGREMHDLVMHAENLGTIPPNTAVMVIWDGTRRYEVRIASDLSKSGTIRFIYKGNEEVK